MNKLLILPLFFSLSCSLLLKQAYDEDKNRIQLLPQAPTPSYCENKAPSLELAGPSTLNQKKFLEFLKKNPSSWTPQEKFSLWVLLHLNLRPDKVSSGATIRLFEYQGGQLSYREFKTGSQALLDGLNDFLTRSGSKQTSIKLAQFLEKNASFSLSVDEELETFLEKNKEALWRDQDLRDSFFKDNQPLKAGESLVAYKALFSKLLEKISPLPDIKENLSSKSPYFCDFDPKKYEGQPEKMIPLPEYAESPLLLGLSSGNQAFVALIDQQIEFKETETRKGNLFKAQISTPAYTTPFCAFPLEKGQLLVLARKERDPAQFLLPIIAKMNPKIEGKDQVAQLLAEKRKMVLHHPTRIILEATAERLSQKRDRELEGLLKGKYPIYQAQTLGQLDALLMGTPKLQNGFISDKRNLPSLTCTAND